MISLIIPTYRNPDCLDLCLTSAIENQSLDNEIIVSVDGFYEESKYVLEKYRDRIRVLDLGQNQGMQSALNYAVFNANNPYIMIINDDNVLCKDWDVVTMSHLNGKEKRVYTINQIEPTGPGIFNFHVKDFGRNPKQFDYKGFLNYEPLVRRNETTNDGGIFPFAMLKRDYMIVGGFDTMYQSPFICDWDFFLKLDLNGVEFYRINSINFYHFGSFATKNSQKEGDAFRATESPAAQMYYYKWGIVPRLYKNNSHRPSGEYSKGIKF